MKIILAYCSYGCPVACRKRKGGKQSWTYWKFTLNVLMCLCRNANESLVVDLLIWLIHCNAAVIEEGKGRTHVHHRWHKSVCVALAKSPVCLRADGIGTNIRTYTYT